MMAEKLTNLISFVMIIISVFVSMSSDSFLVMWVSMEMNVLAFVAFCWSSTNSSWEFVPKYFIVQSAGSSLLLFSLIFLNYLSYFFFKLMVLMFLLLKLGGWPFHGWFITLSKNIVKTQLFLYLSVQKVIPLMMLTYLNLELELFIIINSLVSMMMVMGVSSLNFFMAISSMFTLSWLLALVSNFTLMILYLVLYSVSIFPICMLISSDKFILELFSVISSNLKFTMSMLVFSLLGMPPSMIFFMKIFSVFWMMSYSKVLPLVLLISSITFVMSYSYMLIESSSMAQKKQISETEKTLSFFMSNLILWVLPIIYIHF